MPATKVIKKTAIVENDDGTERERVQYTITVPRKLADEYELGGVQFEWTAKSEDRFELARV